MGAQGQIQLLILLTRALITEIEAGYVPADRPRDAHNVRRSIFIVDRAVQDLSVGLVRGMCRLLQDFVMPKLA